MTKQTGGGLACTSRQRAVADVAALVPAEIPVGVGPEGIGYGPACILIGIIGDDGQKGVRSIPLAAGDILQVN